MHILRRSIVIYIVNFIIKFTTADSLLDNFAKYEVVPDVIPAAPESLADMFYGELKVQAGNELTPTQTKDEPRVYWDADDGSYYTIALVDPDAPSRKSPAFRELRHWIVGNVPGSNVAAGDVIAQYIGAGPPKGTGLHRYVFLVFQQPSKLQFDERFISNRTVATRPKFSVTDFAKKYGLGIPIVGNFFQAQYDDYVPILTKQIMGL